MSSKNRNKGNKPSKKYAGSKFSVANISSFMPFSKKGNKKNINQAPIKPQYTYMDIIIGTMLIVVVGIMPLIVRYASVTTPPELVMVRGSTYSDVFSYWKGWTLAISAIVIAFFCVSDWITGGKLPNFKEILRKPPIILALVFLFFAIVSTIFSNYTYTSLVGTYTRREGLLTWITYFIVFFAAMFYTRETKYAKWIMYGLLFSSIVMGVIGMTQLVNRDFLATPFAAGLILSRERIAQILALGWPREYIVASPEFDIAYGTLFNPNTFGKYTAMVAPVLLLVALTINSKLYIKAIFLIGSGLMFVSLFASGSLGGLVGVATSTLVLTGTFACRFIYGRIKYNVASNTNDNEKSLIKKSNAFLLAIPGLTIILIIAILFVPMLNERVSFLFNRLNTAMRAETHSGYRYAIDGDTITVFRAGEKLYSVRANEELFATTTENWITVFDGTGQELPLVQRSYLGPPVHRGTIIMHRLHGRPHNQIGYAFNIPNYRTIIITQTPMGTFTVDAPQHQFHLSFRDGKIYGRSFLGIHGVDPEGGWIDMSEPVPAWGFYGRETWGSARGMIFSRTFPLMPRHTIIGSGPDTFVSLYPQHDILGLQVGHNNPYLLVDKAHNFFLQTWVTTGGISAIALFGIFFHYILTTFWGVVTFKGKDLFAFGLSFGLLAGVSAFVMSSMATDSTIGSTGVFFVLLGTGYGINAYIRTLQGDELNKNL